MLLSNMGGGRGGGFGGGGFGGFGGGGGSEAVDLVGLAVGARAVAGRVAVGSGAPGVLAWPRPTLTGETPVARTS